MDNYIARDVLDGLETARVEAARKKSRLRLKIDGETFPVLTCWTDGFEVDRGVGPNLRGLVDLYDGERHILQCLIVQSKVSDATVRYEYKRHTRVLDSVPLDYERDLSAPVALLK